MSALRLILPGLALLVPVCTVGTGMAQDGDGGRRMVVDVSQRLEGATNDDLDADGGDDSLISTTRLSFNITSATPLSTLGLRLGARYRADLLDDDDDDDNGEFDGPSLDVDYARRGASAAFSFGASYDSEDVDALDPLDLVDFLDEDGEIPIDLDELEEINENRDQIGTRDSLRFNTSLALRTDSPLGLTFRLSGQDIDYSGLSDDSELEDSRSLSASVTARADLNPVLGASASLRYRFREEGDDTQETTGLGFGLSYRQPTTTYGVDLSVDDVDSETRLGISGRIAKDFPRDGSLNLSLGIVQTTDDDLTWNGSARYSQPIDRLSAVNVAFRRAVIDDPDEGETTITVLSAGYSRSLTRLTSLGLNAQFTSNEDLDLEESESSARVSASLSRRLSRDWSLTGGLSHTISREDGDEDASSSSVFFEVGRSFQTRF